MVMVPPPLGTGRDRVIAADNEDAVMARQDNVEPAEPTLETVIEQVSAPVRKELDRDKAVAHELMVSVHFKNGNDTFQVSFDSDHNARVFYDALKPQAGGNRDIRAVELVSLSGIYTLEAGIGKPEDSMFRE